MNKSGKHIIVLFWCLIFSLSFLSAQKVPSDKKNIIFKATLDSAYIEMGRITSLHVEAVGDISDDALLFMPDSLWTDVEVATRGEQKIKDLGNGRKELREDIILQAFDSGLYTLPPVLLIQGNEVYESNRPALKVVPADIDSLKTINDYYDAQAPARNFFDFLPDVVTDYGLWILLGIIVILLALYIYFKWIKQGRIPLIPAKKPIPPYDLAISKLEELKNEGLWEKGNEKEFYTRLVDILRNYMDGRFGINAMEMTSSQILKALRENESTKLPEKYVSKVLETADFVKFAKVRPMPEDNSASFRSALQFVEDTRPVEEPTDDKPSTNP